MEKYDKTIFPLKARSRTNNFKEHFEIGSQNTVIYSNEVIILIYILDM